MAADILLYQANLVPVGDDQRQHVELARDIAIRFNGAHGDTFTVPEHFIPKVGARIMSLADPTSKMSKSDEDDSGRVCLVDKPEEIMRIFRRAVTDSKTQVRFDEVNKKGVSNLLTIYAAATGCTIPEAETKFAGVGYGDFKKTVAEAVIELLRPIRETTQDLLKNRDYLEKVYTEGAARASYVARRTLDKVMRKVGFVASGLGRNRVSTDKK